MRGAVEMSACGTFETIDRAMSPFLKPVKSGRFYVAALEAGRAEFSARERAASVPSAGMGLRTNRHFIFAGICAVAAKTRGREIATVLAIRSAPSETGGEHESA